MALTVEIDPMNLPFWAGIATAYKAGRGRPKDRVSVFFGVLIALLAIGATVLLVVH